MCLAAWSCVTRRNRRFSHFSTRQNAIDARLIASWAPKPTRLYLGNPLLAPHCRCCGICPQGDPAGRSRARGPVPAPEQRRSRQVSALITRLNAPFKKKKKRKSSFLILPSRQAFLLSLSLLLAGSPGRGHAAGEQLTWSTDPKTPASRSLGVAARTRHRLPSFPPVCCIFSSDKLGDGRSVFPVGRPGELRSACGNK